MKFNKEADKVTLTSKPHPNVAKNIIWFSCTTICHHHFSLVFLLQIKQGHRKYADRKQRQGVGQAEKNTTVIKHIHEQYGKKKRV